MASLEDVANQLNAKLDSIVGSTEATATRTADILDVVQDLRTLHTQTNTSLDAGFTNVSQGLFAILEVERAVAQLLDHHRRQTDTLICEVGNTNDLLCRMSRTLTGIAATETATLTSVRRLEGIAERTNAAEAADYDRDLETQQRIDACCRPPEPEPEPCPEDCKRPKFDPPKPSGQDWQPLDDDRDPIG